MDVRASRYFRIILGLFGIGILVAFILSLGVREVASSLSKISPVTVLGIVIAYALSYLIRMVKWAVVLHLSPWKFFRIYALQVVVGILTPLRMGEVAHVPLVEPVRGGSTARRTGVFLLIRAVEIGLYLSLVFLSSIALGLFHRQVAIGLAAVAAAGGILFAVLWLGSGRAERFRAFLRETLSTLRETADVRTVLILVALTLIQHLFEWTSAILAMKALTPCSPMVIIATYFLASFASVLSFIPGGLGVGSVTWAYLLHLSCADLLGAGTAAVIHKVLTLDRKSVV